MTDSPKTADKAKEIAYRILLPLALTQTTYPYRDVIIEEVAQALEDAYGNGHCEGFTKGYEQCEFIKAKGGWQVSDKWKIGYAIGILEGFLSSFKNQLYPSQIAAIEKAIKDLREESKEK